MSDPAALLLVRPFTSISQLVEGLTSADSHIEVRVIPLLCPTCHGKKTQRSPWQIRHSTDNATHVACSDCGGHGYNPEVIEAGAEAAYYAYYGTDADPPDELDLREFRPVAVAVLDALQEEPEK